ncbi:MAG: YigZ family protein [Flavobacteriaceae bacterium]|nr:YigZ family protein [Flavobacteriaceae bacterium]
MSETKDTYNTIAKASDAALFKDKNSKFFGYAYPIVTKEEVKIHIEALKKQHHSARHWCYAYQLGTERITYRANDDGEPSNSAGQPIYGQIQSFNLTNVLVIVVRYFGGIKLGVSGLINAYRTGAQMALEQSEIIEKTITIDYHIRFDYKNMNKVMRIIKEKQIKIVNQTLALDCQIHISVRKKDAEAIFGIFNQLYEIDIKKEND